MARKRRRSTGGLPLPWERGMGGLSALLFGRRTLPAAGVLLACGVVLGAYELGQSELQEDATLAAIAEMQRATHAFAVEMDRCPRSPSELVHPPKTGVHYLSSLPRDAWDQDLVLECALEGRPVVDVISIGPSGSMQVDDNLP